MPASEIQASNSQTSIESVGNLERKITLRLPSEQVDSEVGGRLREIARSARIKGFRPGKVPTKVVEQRYGKQVRSEVLDGMLREGFDAAIRENELRVAGNPNIEPIDDKDGKALEFVATVELMPEFGDIDVAKLEVVRDVAEIEDADIDRMIENLRIQRRSWTAVTRPAKEGDAVDVETWSQAGDERIPAEGMEQATDVIGSKSMLPEIEAALVGMNAGEEKTVEVTFPEQAPSQLAGKAMQVHLKAERVSEPVMPEVDGAFIRSFGIKSGEMEKFRSEIRSNLERELKGALMNRLRREVGEQLVATYSDVELPPRLVGDEAKQMAWQAMQQQGVQGEVPEGAHAPFMDAASKRVLVGLLVSEVSRRNELRLDPKRANELMRLIASTYEEPQQVVEMYQNDPQLMQGLQARAMEEQVVDWIAERAQHTEKKLTFQEAIAPQN